MVLISLCEAMSHTYVSTAPTGPKLLPLSLHQVCPGKGHSRQLCFRGCPSQELFLASKHNFSSSCCNNTLQKNEKADGMGATFWKDKF